MLRDKRSSRFSRKELIGVFPERQLLVRYYEPSQNEQRLQRQYEQWQCQQQ